MTQAMNSGYVTICSENPNGGNFFIHERDEHGKMTKMLDGKCNDVQSVAQRYIEQGFDPSKIKINGQLASDVFQTSSNVAGQKNTDKIGKLRILFNRLTDEQIANVNRTGELPKGAKFVDCKDSHGRYTGAQKISLNFFNITNGTQKLPAGYELRKDILGFTHIVREGTQGLFLKNK